jgi:hypothetical protein
MEAFLMTLVVSSLVTIGLMGSGLARRLWPGHPLLATLVLACIFGAMAQILLTRDNRNSSGT